MTHTGMVIPKYELQQFSEMYFARKDIYLEAINDKGSPLYLFESMVLRKKADEFKNCFNGYLPGSSFYFAMKSNNFPEVSRIMLDHGYGLDVSSGVELETALKLGAKDIIFSGPGKTDSELQLSIQNSERVTLLVDSFGELIRLDKLLSLDRRILGIGVRLNNNPEGLWRKFGISKEDLVDFFKLASACPNLQFKGLQFHSSWNLGPERQCEFIKQLGFFLKTVPNVLRSSLEFIDIGGGFWPPQGEWLIEDPDTSVQNQSEDSPLFDFPHFRITAKPLDFFASEISKYIQDYLFSQLNCRICFEPGRWLCHDVMHILIQVVDKKSHDLVITDAGTNTIGWERFETDYFPVLNLTSPGLEEKRCDILGSLCTPHDVWGYSYFGHDIQPGDILMIPTQGAYTYSLRQHFIKPVPDVAIIDI